MVTRKTKTTKKSTKVYWEKIDDLLAGFDTDELKELARKKTDRWAKEFKKRSNTVVKNVKNIDLMDHEIIEQMKSNISQAVENVQNSDVLEKAKEKVVSTRTQLLTMLDVPTSKDVKALTRKIVALEKKVKTLNKRKSR